MDRVNDRAMLVGRVAAEPELSHTGRDGEYYRFPLDVERLSGTVDRVNVLIKGELCKSLGLTEGENVRVRGEMRSFNNRSGVGAKLVIYVLARELERYPGEPENEIFLSGTIVKQPIYRRTPMGREICDLMLAVQRRYHRSDYLPVIVWGARAREAADWKVGDRVELSGRLQMRKYIKNENGIETEKTAYEISASEISLME